jgi:hypothetical protein
MSSEPRPEPEYVIARARRALEREAELGIEIALRDGALRLTGVVASEERRGRVGAAIANACPELAVVNDVTVTRFDVRPPETVA